MRKYAAILAVFILICAMSGCSPSPRVQAKRHIADVGQKLDLRLNGAELTEWDDVRDFQGKGRFYAELDMSGSPLPLENNENWRPLPADPEFVEFFDGEESVFGRPLRTPANGYWYFKNMLDVFPDGGPCMFAFTQGGKTLRYCAAFYNADTEVLTVFYRTW